jgi:hypothetical protein
MNRTYKGQILVITLLTLTIVGILVTTIVVITRRDFNQSANAEKYERLYNTADNNLQTLIADYSKPSSNLATIPTAGIPNATCITVVSGNYYRCNFTDQTLTGDFTARTSVFIENKKNVDDYVLKKDSALIIDITNYLGGFSFSWDKTDVALEIAIVFSNNLGFGRLNITRDIYDRNSTKVIDSQVVPGFTNAFPFVQNSSNPSRAFTLDISDIFNNPSAIPGYINANGYVPMYMAVIPRSNYAAEEITLDIVPDTPASLRNQVREFRSLGEDWEDPRGPKASLITKVPLLPEIPAALLNGITTSVNLVLQ